MRHQFVSLVAVAALGSCGTETQSEPDTPLTGLTSPAGTAGDTGPETNAGDETGEKLDIGGGGTAAATAEGGDECNEDDLVPTNATLQGTVFAPNMEIPISGALVYVTSGDVEPVPDGAYCSECVQLTCDTHFTLTEPDGSFELPAVAGPGQQLVVQKGQFLHVVDIDVAEGVTMVSPDLSNLPGEWNPDAGLWIPRIAVFEASPDAVFNVLAKFGLGQVDAGGELIPGTEQFTLINSDADQGAFMDNLANMLPYHIVFVPCAATKFWLGAPNVPALRTVNIRDYVAAGGKWYATDHSNEYIAEPFPLYQDFHAPSMPDLQPAYDVQGAVVDTEMLSWLDALPPNLKDIGNGNPTLLNLPSLTLELNYSGLDAVHEVLVADDEGKLVNVGHHTWVEGPCTSCSDPGAIRPMAVSGQWGCGRMMYSTFENSSIAHAGLNPQELVLLYMILEIGVCHDTPPPPPPPAG